jgi:molybdopterin/thiamine biosynthesis adenylyltransferase
MDRRIGVGATDEDIFDRSKRIGWLDVASISGAKVLMIGAGAIGNEVAKDLVLSGFRRVTIVDMDHVVGSNLNRCLFFSSEDARQKRPKAEVVAEGMSRLSANVIARPVAGRIQDQPGNLFRDHDIVLGCLDNIEARIHVNAHSYSAGRVYIDGGMDGMVGKVMVSRPPKGACLQCGMNRTHAKIASMRFSCTGRDVVFHEPKLAAEITTTSIVSAVMVREVLKVVSGHPEMLLNNAFYYDGQRNFSEEMEIPLDPDCPVHLVGRGATGKRKRFKSK